MKESTIIQGFNQLNNKYGKLAELVQQNFRQSYMIQSATSLTIEALSNILIDKGIITQEDIKTYIQKEHDKRTGKTIESKEKEMESQPTFNGTSEIPSQEGE